MVLSDFDRTLADEKNNFIIKQEVVEVVNKFSEKFPFFVVTGRERKYMNILAKGLFPTGWIIENGGIIILRDKEIKLVDEKWYEVRKNLIKVLDKYGIKYSLGEVIVYVNSAIDYKDKLNKINEAKIEWNRSDAMIMPKNVSKGDAVKILKSILSFDGVTIAIGDSQNDISLFSVADIKVAVANALPEIKAISDIVLDKDDGMGVMYFLEKILNESSYLEKLIRLRK
ncbi:phosphoglycolate phosphatase [Sulfolobus sp. S-194]|uniref:phosphoglycolate phosphatase n=1 Tax=Sulfolobus sp. S-194 TaxID=2512240 RepID=UPI0014370A6E|nr:phosphoglycolate phosphatase [Sulfolobus sp. S-194]QIW25389.1 phosphoglycolate phosphatase [Sulfolobus sp. S-194]